MNVAAPATAVGVAAAAVVAWLSAAVVAVGVAGLAPLDIHRAAPWLEMCPPCSEQARIHS